MVKIFEGGRMERFNGKIFILGCGSVGQCTLPLLLKHLDVNPCSITIMDFDANRSRIAPFLQQGVNFVQDKLTPQNYAQILQKYLKAGDLFIDLSYNVDTLEIIDWCHKHGVLFINTSVEMWDPYNEVEAKKTTDLTLYARQMQLRKQIAQWETTKGPTCILDHGANPGLISHFVKQGLIDISQKILKESSQNSRKSELEKALKENDFAQLASLIGLKTIHVSEKDTQITNHPKRVNEFVNTWSIPGFLEEGRAPAEMGWGTHEFILPNNAIVHENGPRNQICLTQRGMDTWVRSWVPSGEIIGMVIRHGEAFGLSDYLTVWNEDQPIYRPTVHYAYCPCDAAINSLHEYKMRHLQAQDSLRILCDDIVDGSDELGALLLGHDCEAWWIGSVLDIHEARKLVPHQNATTVQVAIGVTAAVIYAIRHPNEGVCLPEQMDHHEILSIAKPYLGKFISTQVNWNPLKDINNLLDYGEEAPSEEEKWQFSTFVIPSLARKTEEVS